MFVACVANQVYGHIGSSKIPPSHGDPYFILSTTFEPFINLVEGRFSYLFNQDSLFSTPHMLQLFSLFHNKLSDMLFLTFLYLHALPTCTFMPIQDTTISHLFPCCLLLCYSL
ncbi:hypothetical protein ACJX0J_010085, partial [Zea mays]